MYQLYDESRDKRYPLTGIIKEIGRTSECDIVLADDDKVSRVHARLDWDGSSWVIVDLGSTNGTFVNGEQVTEKTLAPGDIVEIGDTRLRYLPLIVSDEAERKKTTKITTEPRGALDSGKDQTVSRIFSQGRTVSKKKQ
ncbi:MAG: FHA domain-containing protein [Deltaproteobacteria bacterium]|nr:MAG: FHA domain-containing protein [Deltaproteobacteria bacterium]